MIDTIRLAPLDNAIQHHHHDYHQIVIGLSGDAEFEIAGHAGRVAPLTGCLLPANVEHYYEGIGDNRQLIIDLPDDAAPLTGQQRELRRLFERPGFFVLDDSLKHYLEFLLREVTRPQHASHTLLISTLLGSLNARLGATLSPPPGGRLARPLDIPKLERFVREHAASHPKVGDLARVACLSEAHFGERFRRQTGITPYQFILRLRLELAHDGIVTSDRPLAEIAQHSGFANPSALSHAFRRHYGHPPVALRRAPDPNARTPAADALSEAFDNAGR